MSGLTMFNAVTKKDDEKSTAPVRSGVFFSGKPEYAPSATDQGVVSNVPSTTAATVAVNDVVPVRTTFGGCSI